MACSYCTAAAMGRVHGDGDDRRDRRRDRLPRRAGAGEGRADRPALPRGRRGQPPGRQAARALLRELVERDLPRSIHWRGYFNPTPVSDELCDADRRDERHGLDDGRLGLRRGAGPERQAVPPPAPRRDGGARDRARHPPRARPHLRHAGRDRGDARGDRRLGARAAGGGRGGVRRRRAGLSGNPSRPSSGRGARAGRARGGRARSTRSPTARSARRGPSRGGSTSCWASGRSPIFSAWATAARRARRPRPIA